MGNVRPCPILPPCRYLIHLFICSWLRQEPTLVREAFIVFVKIIGSLVVLSSAIIEDVKARCDAGQASMAYFYFDFRDINKQLWYDLVPSFLIQLSSPSDPRCDVITSYFEHDHGAQQPNNGTLIRCLEEMLQLPDQSPTYLIMGVLDECSTPLGFQHLASGFFSS
jgi:hypothetical protein